MNPSATISIVFAAALVAAATLAMAAPAPASSKSGGAIGRTDEISAAQRHEYHGRKVRPRYAPYSYQPRYRGFADPSFGPDGRPYPVPENLRNQCYIDMGYGRFQACSNRG